MGVDEAGEAGGAKEAADASLRSRARLRSFVFQAGADARASLLSAPRSVAMGSIAAQREVEDQLNLSHKCYGRLLAVIS